MSRLGDCRDIAGGLKKLGISGYGQACIIHCFLQSQLPVIATHISVNVWIRRSWKCIVQLLQGYLFFNVFYHYCRKKQVLSVSWRIFMTLSMSFYLPKIFTPVATNYNVMCSGSMKVGPYKAPNPSSSPSQGSFHSAHFIWESDSGKNQSLGCSRCKSTTEYKNNYVFYSCFYSVEMVLFAVETE